METMYPSSSDLQPPVLQTHELTWKEKLTVLPKQQFDKVRPRVMEMKSKTTAAVSGTASKLNAQLHAKPALFAGIAAGAGLALGIAGRIARHRMTAKMRPTLLIIEGAC